MSVKIVENLFKPFKLGPYTLSNRFVMAAMTRLRADPKTGVPDDLHVQYYTQRASAGLILSEGAPVSGNSLGVLGAGGLYTPEQVKGWKKVIDAIHSKEGRIFAQLWHQGRTAHAEYAGEQPIAPSPLKIRDIPRGGLPYEVPREMTKDDIKRVTEEFIKAAENAKEAGFDGVEVHGATGYLIDEFLRDGTNKRTDEYGGSPENRARFPLEVVDALIGVYGRDKVGIKLSPVMRYNDMYDSDPIATYSHLLKELDKKEIAFVELIEADSIKMPNSEYDSGDKQIENVSKTFRPFFKGALIANNNYTPEAAAKVIEEGTADLVSFGRQFVANPDFVERTMKQKGYNQFDFTTFFTGGPKGYIDYPFHE